MVRPAKKARALEWPKAEESARTGRRQGREQEAAQTVMPVCKK